IKHQELFRRVESMIADQMPLGYRQVANPNDVAYAVLAASTWAVLALTCHIELFVQSHYEESIALGQDLCPLFKDVFHFHWKDECQHVQIDELEWIAEHARLNAAERTNAVDGFIALVGAVDGILQAQAAVDVEYFLKNTLRDFGPGQQQELKDGVLRAYRWQYIISGAQHRHFARLLGSMTTPAEQLRIRQALAPIISPN
ncbi:MAG TPA: hypothetical protein VNH21_10160, partial [Steroidobacteraceae bacterium]|nr:hypothetical protein [Steroidobacteraceae bacterium]